jgi:hypothetical protein
LIDREAIDVDQRWRQTSQVEGRATQEREATCFGHRLETGLLQLGENESIDGVSTPVLVINCGNDRILQRTERPVITVGGIEWSFRDL